MLHDLDDVGSPSDGSEDVKAPAISNFSNPLQRLLRMEE
ncbi:hypothetical protein ASZ90_012327 [hydrocarbon metagenome]|uniref:Uncharacterized protein n=1 Tax=hydrocarbon metagenome TaxID=938273 RepID=A0A0W8FAT1_9ZZZZ